MRGNFCCGHGVTEAMNVCCSPSCRTSAIMSTFCEECSTIHEHDGFTTLRKWDKLSNDVVKVLEGGSNDKTQEMRARVGALATKFTGIADEVADNLCELSDVTAQPKFKRVIKRIQERDGKITGAQIHPLITGINSKSYESIESLEDGRVGMLKDAYHDFIEEAKRVVTRFAEKRKAILARQETRSISTRDAREKSLQNEQEVTSKRTRLVSPENVVSRLKSQDQRPASKKIISTVAPSLVSTFPIAPPPVPKYAVKQSKPISQPSSTYDQEDWPQLVPSQPFVPYMYQPYKIPPVVNPISWRMPQLSYTRVADITPLASNLNLIVKVISACSVSNNKHSYVASVLGDETGIVKANLYANELVKRGDVVELRAMRALLKFGYILLNTSREGTIFPCNAKIEKVNENLNVSGREWEEGEY